MKKVISASLFTFAILLMSFLPVKKIKVIFFGDSITQMGVEANGYVTLTNGLLNPGGNANYDVSGAGIGGNKVYDLYLRMEDDVISKSPDIVVIWIGVNDVWHKRMGTGTDADKFEKFYLAIIKKLKEAHAKVIICTPSTIGEKNDYSNEQDGDLNKYSNIIRKIAADEQVGLIDLRKEFHEYEVDHNPGNQEKGILTLDGVHLNDQGNRFVANLMADAVKKIH
ncbi:MAG TPA: GDSL-type esterase/lipase family protein [Puia sp.]|nr:GDSL-type esterase/lipase family protein [Puia sp.]